MSNPGVITLIEKNINAKRHFRVEDNLGEAIHFHYNDIRIDLSIQELLYIARENDNALYELIEAEGLDLDEYDPDFLNEYSQCLIDLQEIEKKFISAEKLAVLTTNRWGIPVVKPLKNLNISENNCSTSQIYTPIMFNSNPILVYGGENAFRTFQNSNNSLIEVINWTFSDSKHSISSKPWLSYILKWDKKRVINLLKRIAYR